MSKVIKDWNDLVGLESEDYILDIDTVIGCGKIVPKEESEDTIYHYLSTHTFYESNYKGYEKLLRSCGFNITLESWG